MPWRRTGLVLVALLGPGCGGGSTVFVPTDFADTTKTAVFVTHDPLALIVLDASDSIPATRLDGLDEGASIHVLEYDASVEALQLATGPVDLVSPRDGRPFPAPMSIRGGTVGGLGDGGWRELEALPSDLAEAAIAPLDGLRCIDAGGCYVGRAPLTCTIPCPAEPEVIGPRSPLPPAPVVPLDITTCRAGWAIASFEGVDRCVPPPDVGPCAADEAQHVGEASCVRIGAACPAGEWADAPGRGVVYVRAGAVGGTGTTTAPFGTIAEGVAAAPVGAVVALAKGRYVEDGDLRTHVEILGACVAQTVWSASTFRTSSDADVTIENLTIEGRVVARAGHTKIRDAVLDGGDGAAFVADIGRLELTNVVARGAEPYVGSGGSRGELVADRVVIEAAGADGLVLYGATSTIDALRVRGATERGVMAVRGSMVLRGVVAPPAEVGGIGALIDADVSVDDAWIGGGPREIGIVVTDGSTLALTRVAVMGASDAVRVTSARLEVTDLIVEDWERSGILSYGGEVTVHRARLKGSGETGIALYRATTATVTDIVYEGSVGAFTYGISANEGTHLTVARGTFALGSGSAIATFGEGAVLRASDLAIGDVTTGEERDLEDIVATFHSGVDVELSRLAVDDCRRIYFEHAASVRIADLAMRCDAPRDGEPVGALDGFASPLFVEAVRIEGDYDRAIRQSNADAFLFDVDIEGVLNGGVVVDAGEISVERLRSVSTGGPAFDFTDARLSAKDVDVRMLRLAGALCADACRGVAMRLHTRANPDQSMTHAVVDRFHFAGGEGAAVEECGGSRIDLSNGRVEAFETAALVCSDPFDETGLLDRVVYSDLERFVDYVR